MPFLGTAGIGGLIAFLKKNALPSAITGGILSEDSTYFYRTFKGSGTLTVTGGVLSADVLIIAGGGGGGTNGSGGAGGGAGGLLGFSAQALSPTDYAVTVGAGGTGGVDGGANPTSGSNSVFGALTAVVGGGYGGNGQSAGGSGGSGGGSGGWQSYAGGAATSGQGYAGGNSPGQSNNLYIGGGGGGAGGAGVTATTSQAPNGGAGSSVYSSWGIATGTGQNVTGTVYYAGGGGGGRANGVATPSPGSGGAGGGGTGQAYSTAGTAGITNTGGGGGGNGGGNPAGAGGSGIVIVRYLKTAVLPSTSSYELIGTIRLTASQAAVTFSGIPSSQYKHLQIRASARSDVASGYVDTRIKLNGDTTAGNYSTHELYGGGASAGGGGAGSYYPPGIAYSTGSSAAANVYGSFVIDLLDFANTNKAKAARSLSGIVGSSNLIDLRSIGWYSTAAVTTIELNTSGNFVAGSRFSLYGLRG